MIAFLAYSILAIPLLVFAIIWFIVKWLDERDSKTYLSDWYYKELGVGPGERVTADTIRRMYAWESENLRKKYKKKKDNRKSIKA